MEPSDKDAQAPSLEVALFRESILRASMRTGGVYWEGLGTKLILTQVSETCIM